MQTATAHKQAACPTLKRFNVINHTREDLWLPSFEWGILNELTRIGKSHRRQSEPTKFADSEHSPQFAYSLRSGQSNPRSRSSPRNRSRSDRAFRPQMRNDDIERYGVVFRRSAVLISGRASDQCSAELLPVPFSLCLPGAHRVITSIACECCHSSKVHNAKLGWPSDIAGGPSRVGPWQLPRPVRHL